MLQNKEDNRLSSTSHFDFKKEKEKKIQNKNIIEKENDLFSDSDISDFSESYEFWSKGIDSREFFELLDNDESSDEEITKRISKANCNVMKEVCSVEINTLPLEEIEISPEIIQKKQEI